MTKTVVDEQVINVEEIIETIRMLKNKKKQIDSEIAERRKILIEAQKAGIPGLDEVISEI